MKGTEKFKQTIQDFLNDYADQDEQFAVKFWNPKKSIDDCITYILNAVQQSGCNGFEDNEIFGMAVHYFDEENIEVGSPVQCNVVVNHTIELTEEEKEQAHQDAIKRAQDEAYAKIMQPKVKSVTKPIKTSNVEPSLF